jgi:hypothetical protein
MPVPPPDLLHVVLEDLPVLVAAYADFFAGADFGVAVAALRLERGWRCRRGG